LNRTAASRTLPACSAIQARLVVSSKAFSRDPVAAMMALTNFSSPAFCSGLLSAKPKNGCSLTGAL
jgi:hypothetical protein